MGVGGQHLDPVTLSQVKNPTMLRGSQIQSERLWRTGSLFNLRNFQPVVVPTTLTRPACISITYSECVSVALVINMQCASATLSSVACLFALYFPHYRISITIFQKKKKSIEYKIYFDFLYISCWKMSHSENYTARYYHKCTYMFI
jgi:hypothetical protein